MISARKKAIIHVAASQLGMDKDTYRDFLHAHGGVKSSKDLDQAGFDSVIKAFIKAGFKKKATRRPGMASEGQLSKIREIWVRTARNPIPQALHLFLRNRFRVSHERFLSKRKAQDVIEALKQMQRRISPGG